MTRDQMLIQLAANIYTGLRVYRGGNSDEVNFRMAADAALVFVESAEKADIATWDR